MAVSCSQGYAWGDNPDYSGPIGLDYCSFYQSVPYVGMLLMMAMVCWLMHMLAQTASNYFSPTLSTICDKLQLPYDIAGVTLLALGNGAPDFFSLIASFSGDPPAPSVPPSIPNPA